MALVSSSMKSPDTFRERSGVMLSDRDVVRWYLMIFPHGRKGLLSGLEREKARRKREGEPEIAYFAPSYVEAREVDGHIVKTEKSLLFNYVFVRASENELFRLKRHEGQYNFARREVGDDGAYHFPYVSDEVIRSLQWIADSYSGVLPVLTDCGDWLLKGDRVKITRGQFKGIEAHLFANSRSGAKEVMVAVDGWMCVPLLRVKSGDYRVTGFASCHATGGGPVIEDSVLQTLHEAVCRCCLGTPDAHDVELAQQMVQQYAEPEACSDVMRCKLYSLLLMAYKVAGDKEKLEGLSSLLHTLLPSITAEQAKAQLMVTLYGCTNNCMYHHQAHHLLAPWRLEESPKKSKRILLSRLSDYDRCLGH